MENNPKAGRPNTVEEWILEERKFLHDISSPAGVLTLLLDSLLMDVKKESLDQQKILNKVEKSYKAISTVNAMINSRRARIKGEV